MALEKGFLTPELKIPRYRWVTAVILGLAYSFAFYGLCYVLREGIRLSTTLSENYLFVLTSEERWFYNWNFGLFSSILGLYVAMKHIMENIPIQSDRKLKFRVRHFLSDQAFTQWGFLQVLMRLGTVYGIFLISIYLQYSVNLYKNYRFMLVLIPVIFFLNLWPPFVRVFRRKALPWIGYSLIVVLAMSFLYAQLDLYNYKVADQSFTSDHFKIHYPRSEFMERIRRRSLISDFYFEHDSAMGSTNMYWQYRGKPIELEDVANSILADRNKLDVYERDKLDVIIHMDSITPLRDLFAFETELRKTEVRRVMYSTTTMNRDIPSYVPFNWYKGIFFNLPKYSPQSVQFLDSVENIDLSGKRIELHNSLLFRNEGKKYLNRIRITANPGKIFLNNREVSAQELKTALINLNSIYSKLLVIYEPDYSITYGEYIQVIDIFHQAVDELRLSLGNELFGPMDMSDMKNRLQYDLDTLKKKYPKLLWIPTPEERRMERLLEKVQ